MRVDVLAMIGVMTAPVVAVSPWSLIQARAVIQGSSDALVSTIDGVSSMSTALEFIQGLAEKYAGHDVPLTAEETKAITTITNYVDNMLETIKTQRNEDQAELNNYKASIEACGTVLNQEMVQVNQLKDQIEPIRSSHVGCRGIEVDLYDDMVTKCMAYDNYRMNPQKGGKVPVCMNSLRSADISSHDAATQKSMEQCLVEIYFWVNPLYDVYILCSDAEKALAKKRSECHEEQHKFESAFCQYNVLFTFVCGSQTLCRDENIKTRNKGEAAVKISEKARATDCEVGHKVKCLLKIFEESDNAKKPKMLEDCKKLTFTCPESLVYPPVPGPVPCDPEEDEPCDEEWLQTHYKSKTWFSKASADTCVACMHKVRNCDESISGIGVDYRGCRKMTYTGRTCQRWDVHSPHKHLNIVAKKFPNSDIGAHNMCRNPSSAAGIWCFTTDPDKRWDFCCASEKLSGVGEDYRGCQTKTKSGRTCQNWEVHEPHKHMNYVRDKYPNRGLGNHNMCRNPSRNSGGIWCYTTDPDKRWEYCNVLEE